MDYFSSEDPAITWGEWRRLPNGQWHREGQDRLGNWYEENQDEDPRGSRGPRGHRVPDQTPSMEEFVEDFGGLTINAPPDPYYSSRHEGHGLDYGSYEQGTTGSYFSSKLSSDNYSIPSELDTRQPRSKDTHSASPDQFESSQRRQDRGKSSRSSWGDTKGQEKLSRRRTEAKGKGKDIEQQKTRDRYKSKDKATQNVDYSPQVHMVGLLSTNIGVETGKRNTFGATYDSVSDEQDFQEDYYSTPDPIPSISDIADEKSLNTAVTMPQLVSTPRQHIIQQLITNVETILQNRTQSRNAVIRGHTTASGIQERGPATRSLSTGNEVSNPKPDTRKSDSQKKRKKLSPESDGEDSDDEEQAQGETQKGKHKEKVLFACPYAKHGRSRRGPKTCSSGRGWPNIARIKEHLYRRHRQATHCRRCQATFEDINALNAHQREPLPCKLSKGTTLEGFSEAQEKELKSRKSLSKMTEPEKWRKMYTILFPHVTEDQIPSPYYDPEDSHDSSTDASLAEFEAHVLQELPEQLANGFEEELNATGETYNKSLLEQYTRKILNKVFNDYRWNARNMQRASIGSEVAIEDSSSQSDPQVEASSSISATGVSFYNPPIAASNSWWSLIAESFQDGPFSQSVSYPSRNGDQYDFRMDDIAEGSDIQQGTGVDIYALGSAHGSGGDQQSQTSVLEETDSIVEDWVQFPNS